jgi:hypothetical protein
MYMRPWRRRRTLPVWPLLFLCLGACGETGHAARESRADGESVHPRAAAPPHGSAGPLACFVEGGLRTLPGEVRETSGLARSVARPALLWTHNDAGNEPYLFAIDDDGRLAGRVRVDRATMVDWEDIAVAPCGGAACIYIADIGDNDEDRPYITIYRMREPAGAASAVTAEAFHARYPDAPKDAEALFAGPDGNLYVVTKGRRDEIGLYRWPAARMSGDGAVLEQVRVLFPRPEEESDRVTGASATPDGRWVAIRTYRTLYVYLAAELIGGGTAGPHRFDLSPLAEPQGEGVVLLDDGAVWLTSEAGGRDRPPRIARLQCSLPA